MSGSGLTLPVGVREGSWAGAQGTLQEATRGLAGQLEEGRARGGIRASEASVLIGVGEQTVPGGRGFSERQVS